MIVSELFEGELKNNTLDFAADLRENNISITTATNGAWKISYKGKNLGRIVWMEKNFYAVETYMDHSKEFEDFILSENLQEIMWKNIYQCRRCSPKKCAVQANKNVDGYIGFDRVFFGKKFDNTCKFWQGGVFRNPDKETFECIKKVLNYKKQIIIKNS